MRRRRVLALAAIGSGLGIALSAASPAQAEMLYLNCGDSKMVEVDLTKNTVDGQPATITPTHIVAHFVTPGVGEIIWDIDRSTGIRTFSATATFPSGTRSFPTTTAQCTVESAPTTKF